MQVGQTIYISVGGTLNLKALKEADKLIEDMAINNNINGVISISIIWSTMC